MQQLKLSQGQSEELQEKLKQESASKSLLNDQINNLNQEVTSLNIKIFTHQENSSQTSRQQVNQISDLRSEVVRLNEIILMVNEESSENRRQSLKISKKIKILFKAIQLPAYCLKEMIDPNAGIMKTKECMLKIPRIHMENYRLNEENQQLFNKIDKMKSFNEANDFKSLIKDSNGLNYFRNKSNCVRQACSGSNYQVSDWIPRPVFCALEDFRNRHDQVTVNAVLKIFSKLNQLWQERENNRIQRLKKQLMSRNNPSDSNVSFKKTKKPEKSSKTKEVITKEYQRATNNILNAISECNEIADNMSEGMQDRLAESVIQVLADYTDKILVVL